MLCLFRRKMFYTVKYFMEFGLYEKITNGVKWNPTIVVNFGRLESG
jgi:hypothetical protein